MLTRVALFVCLLIGIVHPPVSAATEFSYPMQAQQVADNVFAIITPTREFPNAQNGGWNSNSAFVVTASGVLLFDTGSSQSIGRALRQTIARVTDKPVRWIINSHEHGDHWLGNAAFTDPLPQIYASQTVADMIRNAGKRWVETFNNMTGGITGDSTVVVPNHPVTQTLELNLDGVQVQMLLSGGSHSPGDLMLWLPQSRVLIPGDVVYSDRMPSTGAGDLRQWIETLQTLRALQPAVVIPGHGVVTDDSGLERLHDLLTALWQAVEVGIEAGKSDYEMVDEVISALAPYSAHFPGLQDKLPRDLSHVFLQVEAAAFR